MEKKRKLVGSRQEELLSEYLDRQNLRVDLTNTDEECFLNKIVLVVGGAGTIGVEVIGLLLKKQLGGKIIAIDSDENACYALHKKVQQEFKTTDSFDLQIVNIQNLELLGHVFQYYKPNIVLHFANYKSLVLGNRCPSAFVINNIGGTLNLLKIAASTRNLERFVYVSSDKAEQPSQPYGITKRICELLVQYFALQHPDKKFCSVRYCNVLDAAGSFAIPAFVEEITMGKKVKIRVFEGEFPCRYFITIGMAAKLALKASAECNRGDIFSLDKSIMTPLSIDDLVRQLACQVGIDDVDSWFYENVETIPAEQGEKRFEELGRGEPVGQTNMVRIFSERSVNRGFVRKVCKLIQLCKNTIEPELITKALANILEGSKNRKNMSFIASRILKVLKKPLVLSYQRLFAQKTCFELD